MCIQDLAISRNSYYVTHFDTADSSGNIIVPANPRRIALYFFGVSPGDFSIYLSGPQGAAARVATSQHNIGAADEFLWAPQMILTYHTHPGIVNSQLTISTGGAGSYTWVEVVCNDVIDELVQREFKRHG